MIHICLRCGERLRDYDGWRGAVPPLSQHVGWSCISLVDLDMTEDDPCHES